MQGQSGTFSKPVDQKINNYLVLVVIALATVDISVLLYSQVRDRTLDRGEVVFLALMPSEEDPAFDAYLNAGILKSFLLVY